jgi:hypothetical protein
VGDEKGVFTRLDFSSETVAQQVMDELNKQERLDGVGWSISHSPVFDTAEDCLRVLLQ